MTKLTSLESKMWLMWTQGHPMWEIALDTNKSILEVATMLQSIDDTLNEAQEEVI